MTIWNSTTPMRWSRDSRARPMARRRVHTYMRLTRPTAIGSRFTSSSRRTSGSRSGSVGEAAASIRRISVASYASRLSAAISCIIFSELTTSSRSESARRRTRNALTT